MSDQLLPIAAVEPYLPLPSFPLLFRHCRGWVDLDAPDLPGDLRALYWHSAVCVVALDCLSRARDDSDPDKLAAVLADLDAALRGAAESLGQLRGELHLARGVGGVFVLEREFESCFDAAVRLSASCVRHAKERVGGAGVAALVAAWPMVRQGLYDRLAEFDAARLLQDMLWEAREAARRRPASRPSLVNLSPVTVSWSSAPLLMSAVPLAELEPAAPVADLPWREEDMDDVEPTPRALIRSMLATRRRPVEDVKREVWGEKKLRGGQLKSAKYKANKFLIAYGASLVESGGELTLRVAGQ